MKDVQRVETEWVSSANNPQKCHKDPGSRVSPGCGARASKQHPHGASQRIKGLGPPLKRPWRWQKKTR